MKSRLQTLFAAGILITSFLSGCGTEKSAAAENPAVPASAKVCVDAPLVLTCAETPVLGNAGRVLVTRLSDDKIVDVIDLAAPSFTNSFGGRLLRYEPIGIESNRVVIGLHSHALSYDESYRVQIEPGVFKTKDGADLKELGINFHLEFTTRAPLAKGLTNLVVAADGTGDFCTVQGAVDYVSDDNQVPVQILVRNGTYDGIVYIAPSKDHLRLVGEDRQKTVICGRNNDRFNPSRGGRALVSVEANDFIAENLTIHNTTPYRGSQAEALRVNGDKCVLRSCNFLSFQDTLLLSGRVYVTNCYVEGDVDFIWGQGTTVFDHCEIKALHSGYYVQSRNSGERAGYIFLNCRLTSAPDVEKCYLARIDGARFPHSQVAFINCQMGPHILPVGWQVTGTTNYAGIRFEEFQTTALAGQPLDLTHRHPASLELDAAGAARLTDPVLIFTGQDAWNPREIPSAPKTSATAAPRIFDVRDSGAKGDGTTLDTAAIQKSLDACGEAGGGIVLLSRGTYLSKPIYLRSKTTLQIGAGAILKATDEEADFADPARPGAWRAFTAFVNGRRLADVAITGPGTIDGSGARWWGPAREAKRTNTLNPGYTLPRPKLIVLTGCTNVQVTNLTLLNSPCFHLVPSDCENVLIDDVTITAPADSPNTDAIDPSASRHVLITRCRLDVGDDNVAIKASRAGSQPPPVTDDITVTDCTFLHGHGMSIGSESAGGVRNVTVRHCTFQYTENGLRIKSPRGKGGTVENITYSDITMQDVDPAITFTCYYPRIPDEDEARPVRAGTPIFRNIRIFNLTATCPRSAGLIVGLPESLVSDVVLENVHITAATGLTIRNAKGVQLKNVQIETKSGTPFLTKNAEVAGLPVENK